MSINPSITALDDIKSRGIRQLIAPAATLTNLHAAAAFESRSPGEIHPSTLTRAAERALYVP